MSKKAIFFDNTENHSCPFYSHHNDLYSADFCMAPTVMEEIEESFCENNCPVPDYKENGIVCEREELKHVPQCDQYGNPTEA